MRWEKRNTSSRLWADAPRARRPSIPSSLPPSLPPSLPYLHPRIALDHNIFRLDITVQQTLGVDKSQCFQDLTRDRAEAREGEVGRLLGLPRPALEFVEIVFEQLRDDD